MTHLTTESIHTSDHDRVAEVRVAANLIFPSSHSGESVPAEIWLPLTDIVNLRRINTVPVCLSIWVDTELMQYYFAISI